MAEILKDLFTNTITWFLTALILPTILPLFPKLKTWLLDRDHPARLSICASLFFSVVACGTLWTLLLNSYELNSTDMTVVQVNEKVEASAKDLSELRDKLVSWSADPAVPGNTSGGGDLKEPTMCPAGHYAAGINWWGAPGNIKYCIGCLSGIQVVCRKLNVK